MECRLVTEQAELAKVRNLLFSVYFGDRKWTCDARNPSGLRIDESGVSGPQLVDRFDEGARVFGAFDAEGRLAGALRLITPFEGRLELDLLGAMPNRFKPSYLRKVEINRFVSRPGLEGAQVLADLMACVARELRHLECDVLLVAATEPDLASAFRKLGFATTEQTLTRSPFGGAPQQRLLHLDCRVNGAFDTILDRGTGSRAA